MSVVVPLCLMTVLCGLTTAKLTRPGHHHTTPGTGDSFPVSSNFTNPPFKKFRGSQYIIDDSKPLYQTAMELTEMLCGSSYFCDHTWPDETEDDCFACQFPCSCDENCQSYGDCCVDRVYNTSISFTRPLPDCISVGGMSTFMVTRCPSGLAKTREDVTLCQSPDVSQYVQAIPVSTGRPDMTYRNQFCASCNGVNAEDYIVWEHKIKCLGKSAAGLPINEAWKQAASSGHQCSVVVLPPGEFLPRYCPENMVATCTIPDGISNKACETFVSPILHHGILYQNIFCATCNGVVLDKAELCSPPSVVEDEEYITPETLQELLNFDPVIAPPSTEAEPNTEALCDRDQVFDPFGNRCLTPKCEGLNILIHGNCEPLFSTSKGLGFSLFFIMKPEESIENWETFTTEYEVLVRKFLLPLQPFYLHLLGFQLHDTVDRESGKETLHGASVTMEILVMAGIPLKLAENILQNLLVLSWRYTGDGKHTVVKSKPYICSENPDNITLNHVREELIRDSFDDLADECDETCLSRVEYSPVGLSLSCPYIELGLSGVGLTYFSQNNTMTLDSTGVTFNDSFFRVCKDSIKICAQVLNDFQYMIPTDVLNETKVEFKPVETNALTIVSTVSITLSLTFLLLTFLIYTWSTQLQSLSEKINTSIVAHLFLAQMIFLVGTEANGNTGFCKTFGVLIHYFWVATFLWLVAAAHHVYIICSKLLHNETDSIDDRGTMIRNVVISNGLPFLAVGLCITFHLANTQGMRIGYGDAVCFLTKLGDIGMYFAAPLGVSLGLNVYLFIKTIGCLNQMPDAVLALNKSKNALALMYIKLSILFGFSWIFGCFAAAFQSDSLWYIFVILNATQGIFVFVTFCVNDKTWKMLKEKVEKLAPKKLSFPKKINYNANTATSTV